jgi:disulfide bond formation protein DsbB
MNGASLVLQIQRGTSHVLFPGAAVAVLAVLILGGAYAFQYIGGYRPCALCLEQRVPWFVLIALGGGAAAAQAWGAPRMAAVALYALIAAVALWSAYLGFFHAGVEYKWWPGPPDCTGTTLPDAGSILGPLSTNQIVRCDEVAWSLVGISMAGFNFLFSLVAVGLAGLGAWTVWNGGRR